MPENFQLKLISKTELNEHTVHFVFEIENNETLSFEAGQFIRLILEQEGQEVFRSYSIANVLSADSSPIHQIELAVSWVKGGLATKELSSLEIGKSIKASAPYGRFCLPEKQWKRYFLVATGTGVTPYRAMQNQLMALIEKNSEVFIVMGARDESGLLYANEFRENAKTESYHYISCLSRVPLLNPTPTDYQGHVQSYLEQMDYDADEDIVFLCGNPEMVDETFKLLKDKGLPVPQIRREKYVSPPKPKPKAAAFNLK
jgi:ferredoxin-NADP reductase